MIDTDKYEGHTEGLWWDGEPTKISDAIYHGLWQLNPNELGKANARLAVDAPLLLAEVKRLQSQYEELKEALIGDSPNWTHDEVVEQALELATLNHNDGDRE